MSAETSQQNSKESKAILDRLERMARRADVFRLGFVKCNSPVQQQEMSRALLERLHDKRVLEVTIDRPIVSLLDELEAHIDLANPPDAVCVYGLEKSIRGDCEASPVLGRLNNDRELLRRAVPAALLLWLPDFALDCMVRGAPDFWAWRSGVYEFPTDGSHWQNDSVAAFHPSWLSISSLSLAEKREEIGRLEELIRTARSLPKHGKREQGIIARLLFQLGSLYHSLGEWDRAQSQYQESLALLDRLGDKSNMGAALHQLGILQEEQGNPAEASHLFTRGLQLFQELGDKWGISSSLSELGKLEQAKGNLGEASSLYEQSLQIAQELGDNNGMAIILVELGTVQQQMGNLAEAQRFYQQSLQINQEMNDKDGTAHSLSLLGTLLQYRGDLEEASSLYEQSLRIARELGDKNGIAINLYNLGTVSQMQGNLWAALENYLKAWELFVQLSSRYINSILYQIEMVRQILGCDEFEAWLKKNFKKQTKALLEALDAEKVVSQ